jgi:putative endonuclease
MARGYRFLGFRLKTRQAEIDLLALRSKLLAIFEVRRRAGLLIAMETVTYDQRERLRRARGGVSGGPTDSSVRHDLIVLAQGKLPRHIPDARKGS